MGILNHDSSRKRKRDKSSNSSIEEQTLNNSKEEEIPEKDIDLLSPEQKSAKKRKKNRQSDSFNVENVETDLKVSKKGKGKKEQIENNLSSPKTRKSKKSENIESSATEKEETEKVSETGESENDKPASKKKKSKNKVKDEETIKETEPATKKKKKDKKGKKASFGVVDSKLLEKSGGEVTREKKPERPSRINRAVDYLHQWKTNRASWKFNKNFQSLLIKAIYNPVIIDEDDFETSLLYFEDCKGAAREILKTNAMELIKVEDHLAEPVDADMERRARDILQMLG